MRDPHDSLITPRLALRRCTPDDLDLLVRLHTDPRVTEFVGGPLDRAQSQAMLNDRILDYYDKNPGLGIWVTLERSSGEPVGLHLLNHIRGESFIQVGYLLLWEYWGRGYATEMAREILRYGFADLGLPSIAGITDLPHIISQRVLLKIGLRRAGERVFAAYGPAPLAWFERDAASWLEEFERP